MKVEFQEKLIWLVIELAGAGMARAQVWHRNRKEKNRRRRDKRFFLEDLDAL